MVEVDICPFYRRVNCGSENWKLLTLYSGWIAGPGFISKTLDPTSNIIFLCAVVPFFFFFFYHLKSDLPCSRSLMPLRAAHSLHLLWLQFSKVILLLFLHNWHSFYTWVLPQSVFCILNLFISNCGISSLFTWLKITLRTILELGASFRTSPESQWLCGAPRGKWAPNLFGVTVT